MNSVTCKAEEAAADEKQRSSADELNSRLLQMMRRLKLINLNLFSEQVVYQEYQALMQIYGCKEENRHDLKASELAQLLGIAPSALSRLLNGMEKDQLIVRRIDPADRRNVLLSLTPQGIQMRSEIYNRLSGVRKRVLNQMGAENMSEMIRLGNRLADILEKELAQRRKDRERDEN